MSPEFTYLEVCGNLTRAPSAPALHSIKRHVRALPTLQLHSDQSFSFASSNPEPCRTGGLSEINDRLFMRFYQTILKKTDFLHIAGVRRKEMFRLSQYISASDAQRSCRFLSACSSQFDILLQYNTVFFIIVFHAIIIFFIIYKFVFCI